MILDMERRASASRKRPRLIVENLETRAVPTTIVVNSLSDVLNPPVGTVTLRSALALASTNSSGNVIDLNVAGTYAISSAVNSPFTILPSGGNLAILNTSGGAVTIDGGGVNRVFDIAPTAGVTTPFTVTIAGVTIQNGVASGSNALGNSGGGIRDQGAANLTLVNDTITGCRATGSGGEGGGVAIVNTGEVAWALNLQNTTVSNCQASTGGGIEADGQQGSVVITGGSLIGNTAVAGGAALRLGASGSASPNASLTNVNIASNTSTNGPTGAVGNFGNGTVAISGSVFQNNTVGGSVSGVIGGAAFGDGSGLGTFVVQNSQFLGNTDTNTSGNGGAIYLGGPGTTSTITNVLIRDNTAANSGGGIYDPGSNLTMDHAAIDANTAGVSGGAGLDVVNSSGGANPTLTNVTFSLFTNNRSTGASGGGAINQTTGNLTIASSQFSGNTASFGGGVSFGGSTLSLSGSAFFGNSSTGHGGAIDFGGTGADGTDSGSAIVNSTFNGNQATGTNGDGGAIAVDGTGNLSLAGDTINANLASASGGGVFLGNNSPPAFVDTIVYGNVATSAPDVGSAVTPSSVIDLGGNLIGTAGNGNSGFGGSTLTVNPLLVAPADNGGPFAGVNPAGSLAADRVVVETEALGANSPALAVGTESSLFQGVDGRGFARPASGSSTVSIGAYEPQFNVASPPSVTFVVEPDGQVYNRPLSSAQIPTGGYQLSGYGQVNDLAVARINTGTGFETFAVGTDKQLYAQTIDASNNASGYFSTAYGSIASISVGSDTSGRPLLFAVGTDNQLYELKFNANGTATTTSYTKAAYGNFRTTVLTHDASGNPLLYAIGTDGQVYGLKMDANGNPVGGLFKVDVGNVNNLVVGHDASNNPEIFVIETNGGVYIHKLSATGSPVGSYVSVSGPAKAIAVTSLPNGRPLLFTIGSDNHVYSHQFDATGSPIGGYVGSPAALGGTLSIAAGIDSSGNPELYEIAATDNQVYLLSANASGVTAGSLVLTTPGAVRNIYLG